MRFSQGRIGGWVSVVVALFVMLCLLLANVLLSAHGAATNLRFYQELWARYNVPAETGMSMAELSRAGRALVDYFTGDLASPQIDAVIFGETRPLFNTSEIAHLEDVKDLFQTGLTAEWMSIAAAFAGTMLLLTLGDRRAASVAFLSAGAVSLLVLLLLAMPAAADFTGWWTNFHLLTFTNDLWLLDPNTDWLIMMFPEGFFLSMVERIGVHAAITALVLLAAGFVFRRHRPGKVR